MTSEFDFSAGSLSPARRGGSKKIKEIIFSFL